MTPTLRGFTERHGGTVFGSTRAELQRWTVDIQKMTATCETGGQRQLSAMQPRLNVEPLVEEIAALIVNRQQDERLKWHDDGHVQVVIGKLLPDGSAVKQTLTGRRKRFRLALTAHLLESGWQEVRANVYRRL